MPTDAESFFYDHAGYGYDPATETAEQGRTRCARELAVAEQWARDAGLTFSWAPDWASFPHVSEFPDAYDEEPETCETAIAYNARGEVVASLGCIDDSTDDYRRVVEAELAAEAMDADAEDAMTNAGQL